MSMTLFLYQLSHQVFQTFYVIYTLNRFEWKMWMVGGSLAVVGILNAFVQGGLIRPAKKRYGERVLVIVGLSGAIVGFLLYSIAWTGAIFFACTFVFALMGFFNASITGIMSKQLGPSEQGQLSGANSSLNGIAGMIGPALFTGVASWTSIPNSPTYFPGAPFALAAAILMVALTLAVKFVPKAHAHEGGATN